MMNETVLKIENLKKEYTLGEYNSHSAAEEITKAVKKLLSKNDYECEAEKEKRIVGKKLKALDGIDLEVKKGEVLGIIGANGSGKSTLLKLITHITEPSAGTIGIKGKISSLLEIGTGFNAAMTGRENIYLSGAILGMTIAEIESKIDRIIEFSECEDFIDTPVKRYSSGMFVKLAFSVAAHLNNDILILDEVLAVGDVKFQTKCLKKMSEIANDENRTILYVSHTMSTIRRLCNRCIVLDKGKKVFDGDTNEAIEVYLGGKRKAQLDYDTTDVMRPSDSHGKYMRIEALKFDKNNEFSFIAGEQIGWYMTWTSKIDADKMFLRIEIQTTEGITVGVAESQCLGAILEGQTRHTHFLFDTSELSDGLYYMLFDLYTKNEDGSFLSYDRPLTEVPFSIRPAERGEINWQHQCWGRVRLKEMTFSEVDK